MKLYGPGKAQEKLMELDNLASLCVRMECTSLYTLYYDILFKLLS
jgi:hypothetical protein